MWIPEWFYEHLLSEIERGTKFGLRLTKMFLEDRRKIMELEREIEKLTKPKET